jgi:hypothetical protein
MRDKLSSEKLADRVRRMSARLEAAAVKDSRKTVRRGRKA